MCWRISGKGLCAQNCKCNCCNSSTADKQYRLCAQTCSSGKLPKVWILKRKMISSDTIHSTCTVCARCNAATTHAGKKKKLAAAGCGLWTLPLFLSVQVFFFFISLAYHYLSNSILFWLHSDVIYYKQCMFVDSLNRSHCKKASHKQRLNVKCMGELQWKNDIFTNKTVYLT